MRVEHFQFIDSIEELNLESPSARCLAHFPTASPLYEGHFPGYPLVPGNLLVECMAQASGALMLRLNGFTRMPFLAQVEKARFRVEVQPGTSVSIESSLTFQNSRMASFSCRCIASDREVATANLRLTEAEFANEKLRAYAKTFVTAAMEKSQC